MAGSSQSYAHGSSLGELSEQEANTCRRQDLIENPHITAWYFERRFKLFFEKVLVPKWNLEDWWFRFEWQHRGCSHVHGIAKRKDAPIIDWDEMKNDYREEFQVFSILLRLENGLLIQALSS